MQVAVVSQLAALGRWINYTSTRSIDRNRHKSLDKGHFGERNHKTNGRLDQFTETPKVCYVHWNSWKRIRCFFEKHFHSHKSKTGQDRTVPIKATNRRPEKSRKWEFLFFRA